MSNLLLSLFVEGFSSSGSNNGELFVEATDSVETIHDCLLPKLDEIYGDSCFIEAEGKNGDAEAWLLLRMDNEAYLLRIDKELEWQLLMVVPDPCLDKNKLFD